MYKATFLFHFLPCLCFTMTLMRTALVKVYAKKFQMWLAYRMAEGVLFLFRKGFKALPVGMFRLVTGSVAGTLISIFLSRRKIIKNLDKVLGETYSPATKKGLARGVQWNIGRNAQDCIFQWLDSRYVFENVTVTGIENLEAGLAKGKGVIALGAHLGNYVLVGA